MSIIFIQIGQCGNQLCLKLFSDFLKELRNSPDSIAFKTIETFFHKDINNKLLANAILIDMESKVIEKCFVEAKKAGFEYNKDYVIKKQSGSGNNWANGFFYHGPSIEDEFISKLSRLIDYLFIVDSVVVINSLAGGTGSGLGSYINVLIKDSFPQLNLISINIWPNSTGEVIVSSYNTLLSLSESYKVSDMCVILDNQELFDTCKNIFKIKKINFDDINNIASRQILSCIYPIVNNKQLNYKVSTWDSKSIIFKICDRMNLDSRYKFTKIYSIPEISEDQVKFSNESWSALLKSAKQSLVNSKVRKGIFIFRGNEVEDLDIKNIINNENCSYSALVSEHTYKGLDKHLSLFVNSDFIISSLEKILDKATQMLDLKLFTHHYYKYGLEYDDFLNCFSFCNQIINDYKTY